MALSFYWHDYETWGADPSRDRPAQFAGVRTDTELNIVEKPLQLFCSPPSDCLPHPEACLVTGITPQQAQREGVVEADFFRQIHARFSLPGTCGVGYNSIRFDDEVTRFGFYRNFLDPYAREWRNGNSRWDIIDMVRLTHALRPAGINWPLDEDGVASFRLERLTAANGIEHAGAHDAMSDVHATIELARLVRRQQPRLFNYLLELRDKRRVAGLLDLAVQQPVLHVSSMYAASRGCIAMVAPLARHPVNSNGVLVFDLCQDPEPLIQLEAEEIARRLFTRADELPPGVERIPLKTVHLNKSPAVVPMSTLTEEAAERWSIDTALGERNLARLRSAAGLTAKIQRVFGAPERSVNVDPDQALYSGGFFTPGDRKLMERVASTASGELRRLQTLPFADPRLPEMLFRYRARNWPGTLSAEESQRWERFRIGRLNDSEAGLTLAGYRRKLATLMVDPAMTEHQRRLLSDLADWPQRIGLD
ncbi:MAG: exodeoxyribonuclease I [Gammaproteobacteria bacterium]|nr:exodeoxyribonuclease I [Gammaproteobacteria bacterium]